jgi:hypothetical protein
MPFPTKIFNSLDSARVFVEQRYCSAIFIISAGDLLLADKLKVMESNVNKAIVFSFIKAKVINKVKSRADEKSVGTA